MQALLLLINLLCISGYPQAPKYPTAQEKVLKLAGEWQRVGNLEGGNISEVTFYPSGALNITDKNKTHLLVMRYRLLSETEPLRGEIIPTPFGLGEPEDRISFTVHFISPTSIDFKYTAGGKTQTIYLKKVKEIAHGIVPLNS